ncbi:MAG: NAD(+) synthase [Treponema sp.]|jgi:NAD+ synthase|nr:NAD(+) synthase [Treponema sp.]
MVFEAERVKNEAIQWIRGFFDKNGKDCHAVVGISGGKDSSVTAALCAQALGADRVYGLLMPLGEQWDINIARDLVKYLRIRHSLINIKTGVDALFDAITEGGLAINKQAAINTPARIRMAALYAAAASIGGLAANTCNLSEDWVGYSTKFGDSAGDFSPLSRLTVTEVKALGRALGLPAPFIEKVPEDGLSGMSDEEKLGFSYDILDRYIREGVCEDQAVKEKIDRLHTANLHKVTLMPCYEYSG